MFQQGISANVLRAGRIVCAILASITFMGAAPALAQNPWGTPSPLDPNASVDSGEDFRPSIATNGVDHWIAVWQAIGTDDGGGDYDIFYSVSDDGGGTWSTGTPLNNTAGGDTTDDLNPRIVYAPGVNARFIVVWQGADPFSESPLVKTAFSVNNGSSWSEAPLTQAISVSEGWNENPSIGANSAGKWIITSGRTEIYHWVSTAGFFLPQGVLLSDPEKDFGYSNIAAGPNGTWVMAAVATPQGSNEPRDIVVITSIDNAANFSPVIDIAVGDTPLVPATNPTGRPQLSRDGNGNWLIVWQSVDSLGDIIGEDSDILVSTSRDRGFNWSAPAFLNSDADSDTADDIEPSIHNDVKGTWIVVWSNSIHGVRYAKSLSLGRRWSDADSMDPDGVNPVVRTNGQGHWITAWSGIKPDTGGDNDIYFSGAQILPVTEVTDLAVDLLPLPPGETAYYCAPFNVLAEIRNLGPLDAPGVFFDSDLEPLFDLIDAEVTSGSCTISGDSVACDIGDLPVDALVTATLIVKPNTLGSLPIRGTVSSDINDTGTQNNEDVEYYEINDSADLFIETFHDPDPGYAGLPLTLHFTVINQGPATSVGVNFLDRLPSNVTIVSAESSVGIPCEIAGRDVSCFLGDLPWGPPVTVQVEVVPQSAGLLTHVASVISSTHDCELDDNTVDETITILEMPSDMRMISKIANPSTAVSGSPLSYTITVENFGPGVAKNVTITDPLDLSAVILVAAGVSHGSYSVQNGNVIGHIGTLPVDDPLTTLNEGRATLTIIVRPRSGVTQITNTANVTISNPEFSPGDEEITIVTPVVTQATELGITKTANISSAAVGTAITYTISVTNQGPDPATQVWVQDVLPEQVFLITGTVSQGQRFTSGRVVSWSLGTLGAGATATMTLEVMAVSSGATVNTATVSGFEPDTNPANNSASVTVDIVGGSSSGIADLQIVKTAPLTAVPGADFVYTITVTNVGPDGAQNVRMIDELPAELTYVSSTSTQGTVSVVGNTVTASIGAMLPGSAVTVTITARASAEGVVSNTAIVVSDTSDPEVATNTSTAVVTVSGTGGVLADVQLTGFGAPQIANIDTRVRYTFTARNNGPERATSISMTQLLPASADLAGASASRGECNVSGPVLTCILGDLDAGQEETVIVTVTPRAVGTLTTSANISAAEIDVVPDNNTTFITTEVVLEGGETPPGPDLTGRWISVSKSTQRGRVFLRGKLRLLNQGTEAVRRTTIEYYLSEDNVLSFGDLRITGNAAGGFRPRQARNRRAQLRLPAGIPVAGQYLIAVIQPADGKIDAIDTNNTMVWGPFPSPE